MSLWQRVSTLFRSNINDAISKAEDPEKLLNQLIADMNTQLVDAKKQVRMAIADAKRLKKQAANEETLAGEWEGKAITAVESGRDDLARQCLARQQEHGKQALALQDQWQKQRAAADGLKQSLQQLNDKIEEAKRKKNLLIARSRRADAQKKIQETMSGLSDDSAFAAFDRMAEKVDQKEAEADAQAELSGILTGDTLSADVEALGPSATDDALAALKAKVSGASGPAALPPASADALDIESLEKDLAAHKAATKTE